MEDRESNRVERSVSARPHTEARSGPTMLREDNIRMMKKYASE